MPLSTQQHHTSVSLYMFFFPTWQVDDERMLLRGLGTFCLEETGVFQANTHFEHISMESWDIYLEETGVFQANTHFEDISME